jgi:hypothetical protein
MLIARERFGKLIQLVGFAGAENNSRSTRGERFAIARPKPPVAPVTRAVFPPTFMNWRILGGGGGSVAIAGEDGDNNTAAVTGTGSGAFAGAGDYNTATVDGNYSGGDRYSTYRLHRLRHRQLRSSGVGRLYGSTGCSSSSLSSRSATVV